MYDHIVINVPPETQRVNLSNTDYATFYCQTTGLNSFWSINMEIYSIANRTETNGYIFGQVTEYLLDGTIAHDLYLRILASADNNNTVVVCVSILDSPTFSAPAELIIQG